MLSRFLSEIKIYHMTTKHISKHLIHPRPTWRPWKLHPLKFHLHSPAGLGLKPTWHEYLTALLCSCFDLESNNVCKYSCWRAKIQALTCCIQLKHVACSERKRKGWEEKLFKTQRGYASTFSSRGGGGSFKNRKPIGEVGCCESRMAERIHWWTDRWLELCFLEWLQWLQWSPYHNCWMQCGVVQL